MAVRRAAGRGTLLYTRAVLGNPRHQRTLARLPPRALHDLRGKDSIRAASMSADAPARLRRASLRGMPAGRLLAA